MALTRWSWRLKTVSDLTEAVKNRELAEAAVCKPRHRRAKKSRKEGVDGL